MLLAEEFGGLGTSLVRWVVGLGCVGFVVLLLAAAGMIALGGKWLSGGSTRPADPADPDPANPVEVAAEHIRRKRQRAAQLAKEAAAERAQLDAALREGADESSS